MRADGVRSGANASPDFEDNTDTRTVPESTAVGDPVGDPVTATDPDSDILTYELDRIAEFRRRPPTPAMLQFFDIDHGDRSDRGGARAGLRRGWRRSRSQEPRLETYTVIVRATDPSGLADNITVTITAENVNEDPIVTGRAELSVAEGITDDGLHASSRCSRIGPVGREPTNQRNEYVYEEPDYLDSIARWAPGGRRRGCLRSQRKV